MEDQDGGGHVIIDAAGHFIDTLGNKNGVEFEYKKNFRITCILAIRNSLSHNSLKIVKLQSLGIFGPYLTFSLKKEELTNGETSTTVYVDKTCTSSILSY
ncbi:hypothetical protein V1477_015491 [Vespula maculifrons]|uniref:Uncharacterized protein n=1 Tax=Vespula maculifrons TaxID=7453 RepID=A0ABD2BFZ9_VESMC